MPVLGWISLGLVALLGWAMLSNWLLESPTPGDVATGLVYRSFQVYARVVHGLRVVGRENLPDTHDPGPLIVVVNHTAGIDPVLAQSVCTFKIRWMMASDMMLSRYAGFWDWAGIISVDRAGTEIIGTREAIRHVQEGEVLGIFPEGGIERPSRTVLPFLAGVGLIIKKTKARVLPLIIEGTPEVNLAWTSLYIPSRSKITVMPAIDYTATQLRSHEIAEDLRRRYVEWTGWPANEGPGAPG